LEALILRVGQAVARCGCSEAFWVGNLKHRDLVGEELPSQVALMELDEVIEKYSDVDVDDADYDESNDTNPNEEESNDNQQYQLSKEFISTEYDTESEL
jgi:hypothetical protein